MSQPSLLVVIATENPMWDTSIGIPLLGHDISSAGARSVIAADVYASSIQPLAIVADVDLPEFDGTAPVPNAGLELADRYRDEVPTYLLANRPKRDALVAALENGARGLVNKSMLLGYDIRNAFGSALLGAARNNDGLFTRTVLETVAEESSVARAALESGGSSAFATIPAAHFDRFVAEVLGRPLTPDLAADPTPTRPLIR